jgi:hypothetical protein
VDKINIVCDPGDVAPGAGVSILFRLLLDEPDNQSIVHGAGVFSETADAAPGNNETFRTVPRGRVLGDVDGDGNVSLADLQLVNACLGMTVTPDNPACARADIDGDGNIDARDAAILAANIPPTPPAQVPSTTNENPDWGAIRYYTYAFLDDQFLPSKDQFFTDYGRLAIQTAPAGSSFTQLGSGKNELFTNVQNNPGNTLYGTGGALPCVGLILSIPGNMIRTFHFHNDDDPRATLEALAPFPPGTRAAFFGGTDDPDVDGSDLSRANLERLTEFLDANKATITVDGYHPGDTLYVDNANNYYVRDVRASSITSLESSSNPSVFGQAVTFTATVTPGSSSTPGVPGGTITFFDGSTPIGNATLDSSGRATLTTSGLTVGSHQITAAYSGDDRFGFSNGTLSQTVNTAGGNATSTTITSSENPSIAGQPVSFVATVSAASGVPAGIVTFRIGSIAATAILAGGQASITIPNLSPGSHAVTATYLGNTTFNGSESDVLTQVVNPPLE